MLSIDSRTTSAPNHSGQWADGTWQLNLWLLPHYNKVNVDKFQHCGGNRIIISEEFHKFWQAEIMLYRMAGLIASHRPQDVQISCSQAPFLKLLDLKADHCTIPALQNFGDKNMKFKMILKTLILSGYYLVLFNSKYLVLFNSKYSKMSFKDKQTWTLFQLKTKQVISKDAVDPVSRLRWMLINKFQHS